MVLHWALANRPDTIILSASWPTDADSLSKLDATVKALRSADLVVVIIGQTPTYIDGVPSILARRLLGGNHDSRAEDEGTGGPFAGDYYMKGRYSGLNGVRYISSWDTFCKDRECPLMTESGVPVWWDKYHFTREGADLALKHLFRGALVPAMAPVAPGTADK